MKKLGLLLIATTFLLPLFSFGQDQKSMRAHEIGLNFYNLNAFGINYKTGKSNTLFRVSLAALNLFLNNDWGRVRDSMDNKATSYGIALQSGFEHRFPVVKGFHFLWGLEGGITYNYNKTSQEGYSYNNKSTSWSVSPAIYLLLGAGYIVKDVLVISAEIHPSLAYIYGVTKNEQEKYSTEITKSDFHFGFTNTAASVTVAYRFKK